MTYSGTNLFFYSLQVQLSYHVIQTVLKHTSPVLLLLELLFRDSDLKHSNTVPHFKYSGLLCTVIHYQMMVFILLKEVCPSLLLVLCPSSEAGCIT